MAVVDSYSPCPCGSGEKFKWCCQKIEEYAQRAQRLFEGGQVVAAIAALDEGLRKEPSNSWLLTRKALYLIQRNEPEEAKELLRRVARKQPKHLGATFLLTRLILETEGPVAGAAQFQHVLAAFDRDERQPMANLARLVGAVLAESALYPAALKHLWLEQQLGPAADSKSGSLIRMIESNPAVTPWQKHTYRLSEAPAEASAEVQGRFAEAVEWAEEGLWAAAAAAFELLSTDAAAGVEADRNLGLLRLWQADEDGAVEALRRFTARGGTTTDVVDVAALVHEIWPLGPDDEVEQVQWIWPLRDREGLLGALRGTPDLHEEGPGPIDTEDPESPEVDQFVMLDRARIEPRRGLDTRDIPRIVGRLLVGQEIVALESFDDGRLDALAGRFTTLAGSSIAAAHPKTKVLGTVARSSLALTRERLLPEGLDRDEVGRLNREQKFLVVREDWPRTPMPYLGGRTPLEAAEAGDSEVDLRAAVLQLQYQFARENGNERIDFDEFRAMLKIGPEPAIDPETVDLRRLHLARLAFVPVERLDDERLIEFYIRAKGTMQVVALERATRELIDRPSAAVMAGIEPILLYSDLIVITAGKGDYAEAFEWLRRGRQAEPVSSRARNASTWDMIEIRLKARTQPPEAWAPDLAVIMDRYRDDQAANQTILMGLIDMGLIRMVPNSDQSEEMMVDPRPLQALLARYGPRVTTASGQLGVAATRGEIWTPGSAAGSGAIWTPGSAPPAGAPAAAPGGEKPKLIIPGR